MLRVAKYAYHRMGLRSNKSCLSHKRFTTSSWNNADLVQDMYLRELRTYKPSPPKLAENEGQIQKFAIPSAPSSPEEGDIARDIKAYESQGVEVETTGMEAEDAHGQNVFDAEDQEDNRSQ